MSYTATAGIYPTSEWPDWNLEVVVENLNGELKFKKPHESLLLSSSCLMLSGSTLEGLCLGNDGQLHVSQIDLNTCYSNKNGSFNSGDNNFKFTARNFSLELRSTAVVFKAELRDWNQNYRQAEVDLSICIVNKDGRFIFIEHDSLFGRDGWFAKFLEPLPVAGFVVAALHALAGNGDHAMRAVALCTNSTIVLAGMALGALVGGPVGGMIGAGLTIPIGILLETQIAGHFVDDPRLKAEFEEATLGRYLYETITGMAGRSKGRVGKFLKGAALVNSSGPFQRAFSGVSTAVGQKAQSGKVLTVDGLAYGLVKKLADALIKDELPEEWKKPEKYVEADKRVVYNVDF